MLNTNVARKRRTMVVWICHIHFLTQIIISYKSNALEPPNISSNNKGENFKFTKK